MRRGPILTTAAVVAAALAGCAGGPPPLATGPPIPPGGAPLVYAALGASETSATALGDTALRERYAWPQLFFTTALPRASTYYNFGVAGTTTAAALVDQLPAALAVHPTVVTIFFNVDDLVRGVSPETFAANLGAIVHAMREGGRASVFVGNAPRLDDLPAFRACEGSPGGPAKCPLPAGAKVPSVAVVDAAVAAYDGAIASIVTREGAILVDVAAHTDALTTDPAAVSPDGLHPSPFGNELLAQLFEAAYAAHRPR
ncbi:MAG: SGNH/GDSL hydrolase family protein [Candidatus Dormibacter sp.]